MARARGGGLSGGGAAGCRRADILYAGFWAPAAIVSFSTEEVEQHVGLLVDFRQQGSTNVRAERGSLHGELFTVLGAARGRIEPDVWSPLIRRAGSSLSIPPDERSRVPLRRSKHVLCSLHCLERRDRRLSSTYRNRVHCIGWS